MLNPRSLTFATALSGFGLALAGAGAAGPDLLVGSHWTSNVLRYDGQTGDFIGVFATGLTRAQGLAYGPDGNLYAVRQFPSSVRRYDGQTGGGGETFISIGSGHQAEGVVFGPDDNLYVVSNRTDGVLRYDGQTGIALPGPLCSPGSAYFVCPGSGSLGVPHSVAVGPDGNFYVTDNTSVLRYEGQTGAPLPGPSCDPSTAYFVCPGSGGMSGALGLVFGPDDNLYVTTGGVLRYDGQTGDFIDVYVAPGSGGLNGPTSLLFGPDGYLYVSSLETSEVMRYQGLSGGNPGQFVDVFVTAGSGGLYQGWHMTFMPYYSDCNNNGIPDAQDIADCDGSPWCDDCNDNGVPDGCDIADGRSEDCQPNGIPDECDLGGYPDTPAAPIPVGDVPIAVAFTSEGDFAYVANYDEKSVSKISTATHSVIETWEAVGSKPRDIIVSRDGGVLYAPLFIDDQIAVIDTATGVMSRFDVPGSPVQGALSPDGDCLYVSNYDSDSVSAISTADPSKQSSIAVMDGPRGVALVGTVADQHLLYVANEKSDTISVVAVSTGCGFEGPVATIQSDDYPYRIAAHPSGRWAYVTHLNSGTVQVVETATHTVVQTLLVGTAPGGVAVSPNGNYVFATHRYPGMLAVIKVPDDSSGTHELIADIPVGSGPTGVAVSPSGDLIYVANHADDTVSVVEGAVSPDCNRNGIPDECDIADCDGSPWCSDCNGNDVPDGCDIADGTSQDCQPNGVPDECDIASGLSNDFNQNGVPDECEGCGTLLVQVNEHTAGDGGSTIVGIEGLELCVYDKSPGSCVRDYGVSHRHYPEVFENCTPVACGATDGDGTARIPLEVGDYVIIGQYDPDGYPPNADGDEGYIGVSASDFECAPDGDPNTVTMQKHLQVIILPNGRTVGVSPRDSRGRSMATEWVEITNVAAPGDAVFAVTVDDNPYRAACGYATPDTMVVVDSSAVPGAFFMTVIMPFDVYDLNGSEPLLADLAYYNSSRARWEPGVAANAYPSPGHGFAVIGDRFAVAADTIPILSDELGDYGVFWNPAVGQGFVWANVDHATEFAVGMQAASDPIPALSAWGMAALVLMLLVTGKIFYGRRRLEA